jgi:hypothetical protein
LELDDQRPITEATRPKVRFRPSDWLPRLGGTVSDPTVIRTRKFLDANGNDRRSIGGIGPTGPISPYHLGIELAPTADHRHSIAHHRGRAIEAVLIFTELALRTEAPAVDTAALARPMEDAPLIVPTVRPPSRVGKRVLSIYLDPLAWKQLRQLALQEETTTLHRGRRPSISCLPSTG